VRAVLRIFAGLGGGEKGEKEVQGGKKKKNRMPGKSSAVGIGGVKGKGREEKRKVQKGGGGGFTSPFCSGSSLAWCQGGWKKKEELSKEGREDGGPFSRLHAR